jgi:hypothetical protein
MTAALILIVVLISGAALMLLARSPRRATSVGHRQGQAMLGKLYPAGLPLIPLAGRVYQTRRRPSFARASRSQNANEQRFRSSQPVDPLAQGSASIERFL